MITKDKKLVKLLTESGDLVTRVKEITKQMDELDSERNKLAIKHQELKDVIIPIVKEMTKDIGEFEDVIGAEVILDENKQPTDAVEIKIIDRLDEWKRLFKAEKEKSNNLTAVETKNTTEEVSK